MLYSKWRPDRGGYEYIDVPERRGLGDDLPTPKLVQKSPIGVPSTEAGRVPPLAGKIVGVGPTAQGCVMPLDRSMLAGVSDSLRSSAAWIAAALGGIGLGYWFGRRKK